MKTLARLLAIIGLGFVLGTGYALARTLVFDKEPIRLKLEPTPTAPIEPGTQAGADGAAGGGAEPARDDPAGGHGTEAVEASPLDAPVKEGHITLRSARALHERGAFFLDARRREDYDAGHIAGAIWMPAQRVMTKDGQDDLNFIAPGDTVVIYCTGGDCDASENTAIRIQQMAFDFVLQIMGQGYDDWSAAGLPTEAGDPGADEPGTGETGEAQP